MIHHWRMNRKQMMVGWSVVREVIPDIREYILVNTSLCYGRITDYDLRESPILAIQEKLHIGFNKIVNGVSPYVFSKSNNREVDWVTALEVTRDYIESNESERCGNRRLETLINAIKRETGKPGRLPRQIDTLVHAFYNDLEKCSPILQWTGTFFNEYLDNKKKKEMKEEGIRWSPLRGHFIPLQSAIAQMLLRLDVEDFDSVIGPVYRDVTRQTGDVVNVRSYNAFSSSTIEMQKQLNTQFLDDRCKPLLLSIALWVDKAPLNSSMTRKATPVMIYLMNDKTRTPFRIGYAPDDFGNTQEMLEYLLRKQKVSKSKVVNADLIREYKRQSLIDYIHFFSYLKNL